MATFRNRQDGDKVFKMLWIEDVRALKDALENLNTRKRTSRWIETVKVKKLTDKT